MIVSPTHAECDISAYRGYIEAALAHGDGSYTFEDIAQLVAEGKLQFWPGVASVIITEIIEHPRRRALNIFLAGGNLPEIEAMVPLLQEWAKTHACTDAFFTGRAGWERTFLSRTGWIKTAVVFRKVL